MSVFKQFATDTKKEVETGVEVTYGPNDDGTVPTFTILRRGPSNQRYTKCLERESAPYRRLLDLGTLDPKTQEKVMIRVFCNSVLIGWKNVKTDEGQEIAFNFENAVELMRKLPDLYYDLVAQADKAATFRSETLEADAKN